MLLLLLLWGQVSIGSEAVDAAEDFIFTGKKTGKTPIEQISRVYGKQVSVVNEVPWKVHEWTSESI